MNNMHDNTNVTKKTTTKLRIKNRYVPRLFDTPSYLTKITLKKPLSKGSRFTIYFRLERRGNRGSSQNFHGTPFSGDRKIIILSHTIISHLIHMHGSKKRKHKN